MVNSATDFGSAAVTGATGHLGNVLVRELLARGKRVRVLLQPGDDGRAIAGLGVEVAPDQRFLTDPADAAALFAGKARWTMETFYRWQRRRLGYLMDGDEPRH